MSKTLFYSIKNAATPDEEPDGVADVAGNVVSIKNSLDICFTDVYVFSIEEIQVKKRETGIEPATPSLARRCSTAEPLAHIT